MEGPTGRRSQLLILSIPLALFASLVAASILSAELAWSLLPFLDIPRPWAVILGCLPIISLLWCVLSRHKDGTLPIKSPSLGPLYFDILILVGSMVLFLWLSPRTFFLGDGYLTLANLSKAHPISKGHDYVIVWLLTQLRDLLGEPSRQSALMAFRVMSLACGAVTTFTMLACSRRIFADEMRRRAFVLLSITGGSTLLFVGYVEYYPLVCLINTAYCLCCLMAVRDTFPRWVIGLLISLALMLHPVSLFMLPSACVVLCPGRVRERLSRASPWLLVLGITLPIAAAYLIVGSLSGKYFGLRFAVLPITENWYTVDSYTLFSGRHLLDYGNLILLLAPGVLFAPFYCSAHREPWRNAMVKFFFLTLLLPALMLSFLLDPKLGMPRDWDLLSFVGPPLVIAIAYYAAQFAKPSKLVKAAVVVGVSLQICVLGARALLLTMPGPSIQQTRRYLVLDPGRSRVGCVLLAQYYLENGDTASFRREDQERQRRYPAEKFALSAQLDLERGNAEQGKVHAIQAIRLSPRIWEAWINLGRSLRLEGNYDSSLLCMQVANGLNPSSFLVLVEMGMAYLKVGDTKAAEATWLRALGLDSTRFIVYGALGDLYAKVGDSTKMEFYLRRGANQPDCESWAVVQLATYYRQTGSRSGCLRLLAQLEDNSADSLLLQQIAQICSLP